MNFRPLSQKLSDLFDEHSAEAKRLFGDINIAASRISYTRNHHTHHIEVVDTARLLSETELFAVSWALEALLGIVLLREIGLNDKPIEKMIKRAKDIHFVSL